MHTTFGHHETEQYQAEARAKWGSTDAYQEWERKTAGRTNQENASAEHALMMLFAEIGTLRHMSPSENTVQDKIAALQKFITDHYYTCSNEILSSLGQMYMTDERFRKNIDHAGGEGTAAFVSQAIAVYCAR